MENNTDNTDHKHSHFIAHETKGAPSAIPTTKIVSAYGLRKCPKLVEQIASEDIDVRVNALKVVCDELHNPQSVFSCCQAGVVPLLCSMIADPDFNSRYYSAKALSILAKDANGLEAILHDEAVPDILAGKADPNEEVRELIFECLLHVCRTAGGVEACNANDASKVFVEAIRDEHTTIKTILLKALYHIAGSEGGLVDILRAGGVLACVELLGSSDTVTQLNASRTLGFICFDDRGKQDALECKSVPTIMAVLTRRKAVLSPTVKGSLLLALMSITSTDEGKRQCNDSEFVATLIAFLFDDDRIVKLNVLKLISNLAVHPTIRKELVDDETCLPQLKRIRDSSNDNLLKKHAETAISATVWRP